MSISSYQSAGRRVSAKSLAIDLLSTMPPRHPVAVGALVRAAAIFRIGENSTRVALARLRARGLVESDERGLYRLSRAAQPVNREVRSWRAVEEDAGVWDGGWVAVESTPPVRGNRKSARTRARALRLLGFESLTPALHVRPDNLMGGVADVRERLSSLGYEPAPIVCVLSSLDTETETRARSLWNAAALEAGYAEIRSQLASSAERLPSLPREEAMAESFRLGGEAVRRIVLDPLLPHPIVDVDARRAMVAEMRRYDRIGRDCWKGWTGESVELESSPADVGGLGVAPDPA